MKKKFISIFIWALPLLLVAQDVSVDRELGKEGAAQVEAQIGTYQHPATNDYVSNIGDRLVNELTQNPFKFKFQIINMQEPNAFALPGGYVYVSRGLLALVNNEDELACVMGHEIIHVMERHSIHSMKKGILPAVLQLPGALIGGSVGGAINAPISFFSDIGLANYSRGQEKDADRIGVRISAGAGYDPSTLAEILTRMTREVEILTGESEQKSYLSDHPFTPKRVAYLDKLTEDLKQQPKPPIADGREALRKLDGLLYGPDPAQGVFEDSLFLHPDLDLAMVFPGGWSMVNSSSAVGAMQPDGEAIVAMTLEAPGVTVDSAASVIKAQLDKNSIAFEENNDLKLNGFKARSIKLSQVEDDNKVLYSITWVEKDKLIYRLVGAALEKHNSAIEGAISSFRGITNAERGLVFQENIRIVEAKEGETFQELSERTQNAWPVELLALFNGMELDDKLEAGTLMKVAVRTKYDGSKN